MAPKNKKKNVKKILVTGSETVDLSFNGGDPLNSSRSKNSKNNGGVGAEVE
jgi:hypothetical protein